MICLARNALVAMCEYVYVYVHICVPGFAHVQFSHVFDNDGTVLYGLFLCLWGEVLVDVLQGLLCPTGNLYDCEMSATFLLETYQYQ